MYSRRWTRECSESLQRRPALYVQDASSMGESRSLGELRRLSAALRGRPGSTSQKTYRSMRRRCAMTQENGCGRGNEALCRSVFIIFVLRKEDWIMKRMIAAILVLCMVLCSIPVAAAASFDEFFADVPATVENDASYPFAESDDETCLISGNKGMGGTTSALKLTFRSGGTFRFSYKVSSESKYDYMAVTKNGTDLTKSMRPRIPVR